MKLSNLSEKKIDTKKKIDFYEKNAKKHKRRIIGSAAGIVVTGAAWLTLASIITGIAIIAASIVPAGAIILMSDTIRRSSGEFHESKERLNKNKKKLEVLRDQQRNAIPSNENDKNLNQEKLKVKENIKNKKTKQASR